MSNTSLILYAIILCYLYTFLLINKIEHLYFIHIERLLGINLLTARMNRKSYYTKNKPVPVFMLVSNYFKRHLTFVNLSFNL